MTCAMARLEGRHDRRTTPQRRDRRARTALTRPPAPPARSAAAALTPVRETTSKRSAAPAGGRMDVRPPLANNATTRAFEVPVRRRGVPMWPERAGRPTRPACRSTGARASTPL
jgi:hypothetical protein